MAKLSKDYIEWTLKLNATEAQSEYHKLEKELKELQKENNATHKAMAQLEAQGKKGSDEWKNLRNSLRGNSNNMAEIRAKMPEVSKQFDLSSMTVNQLNKRLNILR